VFDDEIFFSNRSSALGLDPRAGDRRLFIPLTENLFLQPSFFHKLFLLGFLMTGAILT